MGAPWGLHGSGSASWAVLGLSSAVLGPSSPSGISWDRFGDVERPSWVSPGAIVGQFEALLGRYGPSMSPLGLSLKQFWTPLGSFWSSVGPSWGDPGGLLGRLELTEAQKREDPKTNEKLKDNHCVSR